MPRLPTARNGIGAIHHTLREFHIRHTAYDIRTTDRGRRVMEIFFDYAEICPLFWIAVRRIYNRLVYGM